MCIAKLDYEVSTVGYKDFSLAKSLASLSIRFFLRDIDIKTHLFPGVCMALCPIVAFRDSYRKAISSDRNSYVGL